MAKIAENILRDLSAELGEQAELLQQIPLDNIETTPSQNADALSLAIFVGYIHCKNERIELTVWAHFYPATRPASHPEIHYLAYNGNKYHSRYDGNVISKRALLGNAFKVPGRWTKAKLQSFLKFCFMEKLKEVGMEEDEEKMEFGAPITKTWVSELRAVCQALEEEAKVQEQGHRLASTATAPRASAEVNVGEGRSAAANVDNGPDSPLSDAPIEFLSEAQSQQVPQDERSMTAFHTNDDPSDTLLTLIDEEEDLTREMQAVDAQIAELQEKRRQKEEKLKQIDDEKEHLVQGLSSQMAFKIGREVGQKSGIKRIKLEE